MKQRLNVSLDEEIINKLRQEDNYSDVINECLKKYYFYKKSESMAFLTENLANLKKSHKENAKKMKEIKDQIKLIKQKEEEILKKEGSRKELIAKIELKREYALKDPYRRVEFFETPEEEADRILGRR